MTDKPLVLARNRRKGERRQDKEILALSLDAPIRNSGTIQFRVGDKYLDDRRTGEDRRKAKVKSITIKLKGKK